MDNSANANIAAVLAIQEAEARTVLATLQAALQELGLENIEGVSVSQWIARRRHKELEAVLLEMGDQNPGASACVQQRIADIVKLLKKARPGAFGSEGV
jgi:hypothetical protein